MVTIPAPATELLEKALVAELTVIDPNARPVTYPLIPLWDGERLYMTSSTLFSRKLEHIAGNPRVSVSVTDPISVGGREDRVTVQGDARVIEITRHFADRDQPIAAICHGVQVLTAAGVVQGRKLTAYPACAPEVRQAGGEYIETALDQGYVDGNLVTAPAWPAHPDWLAKFLRLLGTKITP